MVPGYSPLSLLVETAAIWGICLSEKKRAELNSKMTESQASIDNPTDFSGDRDDFLATRLP